MIKYGNTPIPVIKIPKGTLLFRAVWNPESDYAGVDGCIPPQYNVFFYYSPFVVDGIHWYKDIPNIQVYVADDDLKIVSLLAPSKFTRATRLTKKQFMVPCNKTRKACLKPRAYDPCFRDSFMDKHPSLIGWTALGNKDVKEYKHAVKDGILGSRANYVHFAEDSRGTNGPPELAIYPLKKRHSSDITSPPTDKSLFNYKHIASITRTGSALEDFMNQHAEKVDGKWFYTYKN